MPNLTVNLTLDGKEYQVEMSKIRQFSEENLKQTIQYSEQEARVRAKVLQAEIDTLTIMGRKTEEQQRELNQVNDIVRAYDRLKNSSEQVATTTSRFAGTQNQANYTLLNFGRLISDANYGIVGMANNIAPLTEGFGNMISTGGGVRAALTAIGASLVSPTGLIVLFGSVMPSALQYFMTRADEAKDKINDLKEIVSEIADIDLGFGGLKMEGMSKEDLQIRKEATEMVIVTLKRYKESLEETKLVAEQYGERFADPAKLAIVKEGGIKELEDQIEATTSLMMTFDEQIQKYNKAEIANQIARATGFKTPEQQEAERKAAAEAKKLREDEERDRLKALDKERKDLWDQSDKIEEALDKMTLTWYNNIKKRKALEKELTKPMTVDPAVLQETKDLIDKSNKDFNDQMDEYQERAQLARQAGQQIGRAMGSGLAQAIMDGRDPLKAALKNVLITLIDFLEAQLVVGTAKAAADTLWGNFLTGLQLAPALAALEMAKVAVSSFRQAGYTGDGPPNQENQTRITDHKNEFYFSSEDVNRLGLANIENFRRSGAGVTERVRKAASSRTGQIDTALLEKLANRPVEFKIGAVKFVQAARQAEREVKRMTVKP